MRKGEVRNAALGKWEMQEVQEDEWLTAVKSQELVTTTNKAAPLGYPSILVSKQPTVALWTMKAFGFVFF